MNERIELDVMCDDFLENSRCLYALKARRKKIALVCVDVSNRSSGDVTLLLGASAMIANGRIYTVESPVTLIRKLSEFTWDGLFFAVLDFHPLLVAVDLFYFLIGPLYNQRLKRQLRQLSDGDVTLKPNEKQRLLLGFRRVRKPAEQLQLSYRCINGVKRQLTLPIGPG